MQECAHLLLESALKMVQYQMIMDILSQDTAQNSRTNAHARFQRRRMAVIHRLSNKYSKLAFLSAPLA